MDSTGRSLSDENHADENHSRKSGDGILFGIFIVCALALIGLNASVYLSERGVSEQLAQSEETLRQLKGKQAELESRNKQFREQREQAERDKDAVYELLALCRSAEDIPSFQSDHVIASRIDKALMLYVPAGKHRLEISTIAASSISSSSLWRCYRRELESEQTWNVALPGNEGYMLELIGDKASDVTGWKLTASDPTFEPRQEAISPAGVNKLSRSGGGSVLYPNQRPAYVREPPLREAASNPPPLRIFNTVKYKADGNTDKDFFIAAKLYSEGPATVKATDAGGLVESDLLMPYQGGGKFELRATR
ncbi:MAG: hypothetical protein GY904_36650 [Planctomycetaceae bacterium]|nr:hypothetical protein [Planctomycetaceae bacterium]